MDSMELGSFYDAFRGWQSSTEQLPDYILDHQLRPTLPRHVFQEELDEIGIHRLADQQSATKERADTISACRRTGLSKGVYVHANDPMLDSLERSTKRIRRDFGRQECSKDKYNHFPAVYHPNLPQIDTKTVHKQPSAPTLQINTMGSNFMSREDGICSREPLYRNNGYAAKCSPYEKERLSPNVQQFLEATVIRRHHSTGRSRLDCYRWEQYFLANTHPSIKTVEASANAKVFCETYFNSLKSKLTDRDERHLEFEKWLHDSRLNLTLHESYRQEWFAKESGHLRRSRKLKIRSRCMTMLERQTTPGGFKIIQVLGKGSFGTVCLVQDRSIIFGEARSSSIGSDVIQSRSDPYFESPNKRSRKHQLFRNHKSTDQLQSRSRKSSRCVYAMKVIRKSEMIRNSQEGHVRAERDFLVAAAKSRWVVDLFASFQDKANLYLVMEYMVGGDFLSLLIKFDTLNEKHTRWYIAEMILCVEAVHSLGWIHRDIKPDNFLVSPSGHLKIADFGLAFDGHWSHDQMYYHSQRYSVLQRLNIPVIGDEHDAKLIKTGLQNTEYDEEIYLTPKEREATFRHDPEIGNIIGYDSILQWRDVNGRRAFAKSLVGTSQYMAPEIIEGVEYDGRCDWWSIGVILYECLFGHAPFHAKDRDTTKKLIMSHENYLQIPPRSSTRNYQEVSKSALQLLKSLLTNRNDRLSSWRYCQNDSTIPDGQGPDAGDRTTASSTFVFEDDGQDIKKHRFFTDIKWHRLHLEEPPFVPSISSKTDTKYFDQELGSGGVELCHVTSSVPHEEE